MKVKVNKDKCISCGSCVSIEPNVFEFDEDDQAKADNSKINKDNLSAVKEAMEFCPTNAINEVKED